MNPADKVKILRAKKRELSDLTLKLVQLKVNPAFPITIKDVDAKLEYGFDKTIRIMEEYGVNVHTSDPDLSNPQTLFGFLKIGLEKHCEGLAKDLKTSDLHMQLHNYYAMCVYRALELLQPDEDQVSKIMEDIKAVTQEDEQAPPLALTNISSISGHPVSPLVLTMEPLPE